MAHRLEHNPKVKHYEGITKVDRRGQIQWTGKVALAPLGTLTIPLQRKKPTMYFVNSMSDLFHESLSNEDIAVVWGLMAACPQHTFQVLTKRPERAQAWFEWITTWGRKGMIRITDNPLGFAIQQRLRCYVEWQTRLWVGNGHAWPLPNVWVGTSVESQDVMGRAEHLSGVPAAIRFLSCEPLLGPLDLREHLDAVDWVIVGGESGPGARPVGLGWIRSIVDQCAEAGVACFVKQMGTGGGWGRGEHADPKHWPQGLRVRQYPTPRRAA